MYMCVYVCIIYIDKYVYIYKNMCTHTFMYVYLYGWPKCSFTYSIRCYRKTQMNLLANPIYIYITTQVYVASNQHKGLWKVQLAACSSFPWTWMTSVGRLLKTPRAVVSILWTCLQEHGVNGADGALLLTSWRSRGRVALSQGSLPAVWADSSVDGVLSVV